MSSRCCCCQHLLVGVAVVVQLQMCRRHCHLVVWIHPPLLLSSRRLIIGVSFYGCLCCLCRLQVALADSVVIAVVGILYVSASSAAFPRRHLLCPRARPAAVVVGVVSCGCFCSRSCRKSLIVVVSVLISLSASRYFVQCRRYRRRWHPSLWLTPSY